MAKIVDYAIVIRVSKLVKDETDESTVFSSVLGETIEQMVGEFINDPSVIVEIADLRD